MACLFCRIIAREIPGSIVYVKAGNVWIQSGRNARQLGARRDGRERGADGFAIIAHATWYKSAFPNSFTVDSCDSICREIATSAARIMDKGAGAPGMRAVEHFLIRRDFRGVVVE